MRQINEIIIHCLATRPRWLERFPNRYKFQIVRRDWHMRDNGWSDIGYNSLIWRDGELMMGRDRDNDGDYFEEIGAHTKGHNARSFGVALEGGHGARADDRFLDNFTEEQRATLITHLRSLVQEIPTIRRISGHNEYAAKACPGFRVCDFLEEYPDLAEFV